MRWTITFPVRAAAVRRRFGPAVLEIVDGCTDARTRPKPPFRERKERYIADLRGASPSTRLVSASDKLHDTRSIFSDYRVIGEALWARFNGGRSGTLWYYMASRANSKLRALLRPLPGLCASTPHRTTVRPISLFGGARAAGRQRPRRARWAD